MTKTAMMRTASANKVRYSNSTLYGLYYAYENPSVAKQNAWDYCVNLMDKYNGYGLRVVSYNTFMFTAAFLFLDENGVVNMMYITPNYDIAIEF